MLFFRRKSVPASASRRKLSLLRLPFSRQKRVDNSRFPGLKNGRRYAESSDALHCFFGLPPWLLLGRPLPLFSTGNRSAVSGPALLRCRLPFRWVIDGHATIAPPPFNRSAVLLSVAALRVHGLVSAICVFCRQPTKRRRRCRARTPTSALRMPSSSSWKQERNPGSAYREIVRQPRVVQRRRDALRRN